PDGSPRRWTRHPWEGPTSSPAAAAPWPGAAPAWPRRRTWRWTGGRSSRGAGRACAGRRGSCRAAACWCSASSAPSTARWRRPPAAWGVTRRRPDSVVRETSFVEIGPVSAFHRETFGALLPFPDLRMGWGLDLHWAAVARERGWRMGVVDAVVIAHRARPAAAG